MASGRSVVQVFWRLSFFCQRYILSVITKTMLSMKKHVVLICFLALDFIVFTISPITYRCGHGCDTRAASSLMARSVIS